MPPNLPNVKEDADRTSPAPEKKPLLSDHAKFMAMLRRESRYTDPQGVMHFLDGFTANKQGQLFYPSGHPSDGLPLESPPVTPSLSGRYIPSPAPEPPIAASLGNRYRYPTKQEQLLEVIPRTGSPENTLLELAIRAGFIK